jgi:hypothetical protein
MEAASWYRCCCCCRRNLYFGKHRRVLSSAKRTGCCKLEEVLSYYQAGGERLANFLIIEFGKASILSDLM